MKPSSFAPLKRHLLLATSASSYSSSILPTASASSASLPPSISARSLTQRRFETTTARTKRALNLPPHLSFLSREDADRDVIVFNPPSSAPSVYHTPFKFLPRNDQRRYDGIEQLFQARGGAEPDPAQLPVVHPRSNSWASRDGPRYNVTIEQVAEIKRLRQEDPRKWSIHTLAKKFDCSPLFIAMCAPASADHRVQINREINERRERWGGRKTKAKMEKTKRLELLYSGQI